MVNAQLIPNRAYGEMPKKLDPLGHGIGPEAEAGDLCSHL
jgi:hypothetical protein